jgi:uncharacterized OB-fold protein
MNPSTPTAAAKPVPVRDAATAGFFDGARQGRLMVQHCDACQGSSLLGVKYCPHCLGPLRWAPASGLATLHTYTQIHQKVHPGFAADVPYLVSTARLAEGPMLTLRLVDFDAASARIGTALEVGFIDNGEAEPTPVWRPASL